MLMEQSLLGFVFEEGTCLNSSFPVYFVFFKPMFHQKAKYQASGAGVGQNCALEIPTCWRWPVYFMFIVYISFAFGTQREPHFQWNMGFRL